jgi:ArsR family transcriptional regulator, arsenate/arsenite/antimonite-responsive transcriptional repressor
MAAEQMQHEPARKPTGEVRVMESVPGSEHTSDLVLALRGMAQEIRLEVLALLAADGHEGLPAGEIAVRLGVSPASLSFHFQHLMQAGLVTRRRRSRQIIYAPNFARMRSLLARLQEQWLSPQQGVQAHRIRSFPAELTEDELGMVAGGGMGICGNNPHEYFDIPLILEILDNSTRRLSPN